MALSFLLNQLGDKEYSSEKLYGLYCDTADPAYLQQLITRYGDALYYFLLRQADAALADDISQQCWLKLLEQPCNFANRSSFKTWLFTLARHCLIDELRRQKPGYSDDVIDSMLIGAACPLEQVQQQQQQRQVKLQLDKLPFLQREALMLQLEGFSLAQISQITNQCEETVKSRLRYARQQLQTLSGACDE